MPADVADVDLPGAGGIIVEVQSWADPAYLQELQVSHGCLRHLDNLACRLQALRHAHRTGTNIEGKRASHILRVDGHAKSTRAPFEGKPTLNRSY